MGDMPSSQKGLRISTVSRVKSTTKRKAIHELDAGTPRIKVNTHGKETIVINAYTLNAGEEDIIANALRHILRG